MYSKICFQVFTILLKYQKDKNLKTITVILIHFSTRNSKSTRKSFFIQSK